jgi:hypothetical protein
MLAYTRDAYLYQKAELVFFRNQVAVCRNTAAA